MAEVFNVPKPSQPQSTLVRGQVNRSGEGKIEPKPLKGGISKKELSFGEKVKRSFVKEDLKDIRDYIIFDMIIPNAKRAFFETLIGTTAQVLGISVPRNVFRYSDGYSPKTAHERNYRDYNSISNRTTAQQPRTVQYDRFYVKDYVFTYKEDAEAILEQLMDICDTYGWVSVATFFDLADPEGAIDGRNVYTNNDHGWRSVNGAKVVFDGNGYVITLPPATPR